MDKDEYYDFVYGSMLEQARMFLKAADADGSGKLSRDELAAVFTQVNKKKREDKLRRRFEWKPNYLQIIVIMLWKTAMKHGDALSALLLRRSVSVGWSVGQLSIVWSVTTHQLKTLL